MATLITKPSTSSPDWDELQDYISYCSAGHIALTIDQTERTVLSGYIVEVDGDLYYGENEDETISDWSSISDETTCWIYCTVSDDQSSFYFSSDAPTYSSSKYGWYDGTDRAIANCTKNSLSELTVNYYCDKIAYSYSAKDEEPIESLIVNEDIDLKIGEWPEVVEGTGSAADLAALCNVMVPEIGDEAPIQGCIVNSSDFYLLSRVERYSDDSGGTFKLYGLKSNYNTGGGVGTANYIIFYAGSNFTRFYLRA
jgi:hypothetical protein